jgi:hypothetical protein
MTGSIRVPAPALAIVRGRRGDAPDIDASGPSRGQRAHGVLGVGVRESEIASEVVARTRWQQAEPGSPGPAYELVGHLAPGSVATDRHDGLGPGLERSAREAALVTGRLREGMFERADVTSEKIEVPGDPTATAPPTGRRVEDDVDPAGAGAQMRSISSNVWRPPRSHCSRKAYSEMSGMVRPWVISCSKRASLPRSSSCSACGPSM